MPYIIVSEHDFKRLNELKGIFEVQDVVTKVLDYYLEEYTKPEVEIQEQEDPKTYTFDNVPNLSHAKFLSGSFDDVSPEKANWKGMMELALVTGFKRLGGLSELVKNVSVNIVEGVKEDDGYHFVKSQNFSYQGVSATSAAKCIGEVSKVIKVPVKASFRWRNKEDALHPGEPGILIFTPD